MIIYSKVVDAAENEPVTLDEVKTHLKVDGTEEDAYLTTLIKSARRMCEAYTSLSFVTQTRSVKMDRFPCNWLTNPRRYVYLPYGPVKSVVSFTYVDGNGDEQTLAQDTDFYLDTDSDIARLRAVNDWPSTQSQPNAIEILYTAGDDVDQVNDTAKTMVLQCIGDMYEKRQNEGSPLTASVRQMGDMIKVYWNANAD
jgi:uncharacterized phiE125 gp8 family phage protein